MVERRLAFHDNLLLFRLMRGAKKDNPSIKKAAARLVRELPETASWDDLMYEILVRQKIDAGLADIANGRMHSHASIRKEFGLA